MACHQFRQLELAVGIEPARRPLLGQQAIGSDDRATLSLGSGVHHEQVVADLVEIVSVPVFSEAAGVACPQLTYKDLEANGLSGSYVCLALSQPNFKVANAPQQKTIGRATHSRAFGRHRHDRHFLSPRVTFALYVAHSLSLPAIIPPNMGALRQEH